MAPAYLLDTNIVSDLVRNPVGTVYAHIAEVGENSICTSLIVASELRFGATKSGSAQLQRRVEHILALIPVLSLETPVDRYYAKIRTGLERQGTPIGPNDLLIAAHALALDLTLVTANVREFGRVSDLRVVNWL